MKRSLPKLLAFLSSTVLATLSVTAAESPTGGAGVGPSFKGPIGLQLYSLRADFTNDVPGTLKKVKDYGFKDRKSVV